MYTVWMLGVLLCVAPAVFSAASIPLTRDFLDGLGAGITTNSTVGGRIQLVADSATLEKNSFSAFIRPKTVLDKKCFVGNLIRCDRSGVLYNQEIYLGRSSNLSLYFLVYQSDSRLGEYTLIYSAEQSVSAETNTVASPEINVFTEAGKYYAVLAAWDASANHQISTQAGIHPQTLAFGETVGGCSGMFAPPPDETLLGSNIVSETLFLQQMNWSSNRVVRMDSTGGIATNRMDLSVDLEGYNSVSLTFLHREIDDEIDPEDGIFLSVDNGVSFSKIASLGDDISWTFHGINLTDAADGLGLTLSSSSVIRFQQKDNLSWIKDGREFDDIQVYARPVLDLEPVSNGVVRLNAQYCPVGKTCYLHFCTSLTNDWYYYSLIHTDALHPTTNWILNTSSDKLFFRLQEH